MFMRAKWPYRRFRASAEAKAAFGDEARRKARVGSSGYPQTICSSSSMLDKGFLEACKVTEISFVLVAAGDGRGHRA
jgi:hypothetical protein